MGTACVFLYMVCEPHVFLSLYPVWELRVCLCLDIVCELHVFLSLYTVYQLCVCLCVLDKNELFSASHMYIMVLLVLVGDTNLHSIFTLGQLQRTESNDYNR